MLRKNLASILFIPLIIIVFLNFGCKSLPKKTNNSAYNIYNDIPNFRKIDDNIYAGGRLDEEDVKQLALFGIKTIVNLESGFFMGVPLQVKQEQEWANKAGIRFLRVPMNPILDPEEESIAIALNLITDPKNYPVFIHCKYGRDRTGIVIATYRLEVNKWTLSQAYREMKDNGFHWYFFWWKEVFHDMREHKNWRTVGD